MNKDQIVGIIEKALKEALGHEYDFVKDNMDRDVLTLTSEDSITNPFVKVIVDESIDNLSPREYLDVKLKVSEHLFEEFYGPLEDFLVGINKDLSEITFPDVLEVDCLRKVMTHLEEFNMELARFLTLVWKLSNLTKDPMKPKEEPKNEGPDRETM
jgi:hypothetical protein